MGRNNKDLRIKRNRAIVEKFHELYDVKRMRIDDVLEDLQDKYFFLSKDTIYKLIFYTPENHSYYQRLCDKKNNKENKQISLFT